MAVFIPNNSYAPARRFAGRRVFLSFLLLSVSGLIACGDGASSASPPEMPPTKVELAEVQPVPLEDAGEFVATLRSLRSTTIRPDVSGQIRRIHVSSGDRVKPGMPLMQIDARRQEATVSSQEAGIHAQRANVQLARQERDRAKELLDGGIISQQDFDQLDNTYSTAQAQLESLEAQLSEQRVNLQFYQVLAPTVGVVGDIPVRVGMYVSSETDLTTIDGEGMLEVYVQVPVERAANLKLGLPLTILDSSGNELTKTTVSYVSPRVNNQTQSILVKGRLPSEAALRSDQFVRARIVWQTTQGLAVPVLSVTRTGSQHFVYVAESQDGKLLARQRPIEVGQIVGNNFTVRKGLEPNERIVVSGVQTLFDGAPIAAGS
ncbi:MAG: efflux RND transporter periplasmic adaptor subunit [Luteitalea sp.]|nr:efflux RND transporter periplasmic adaptor subunit [Luteitalea sp.]